jgi:hypothetical protein
LRLIPGMALVYSMVDEAPFARRSWGHHTGVFAVFRCVVGALLTISGLLQLFGLPGEVRVWIEAVGRVALGIALMAAPSRGDERRGCPIVLDLP